MTISLLTDEEDEACLNRGSTAQCSRLVSLGNTRPLQAARMELQHAELSILLEKLLHSGAEKFEVAAM